MKKYESDALKAMSKNGGCYLDTHSETLEGLKQEIDSSNERAVSLGYKSESWLIVYAHHCSWYDDNGQFVKSEHIEQALEVYPPEN